MCSAANKALFGRFSIYKETSTITLTFDLRIHNVKVKLVCNIHNGENIHRPFQKVLPNEVLIKLVEKLKYLKHTKNTTRKNKNLQLEIRVQLI